MFSTPEGPIDLVVPVSGSLISTLPHEILAKIFLFFNPSQCQKLSTRTDMLNIEAEWSRDDVGTSRTWWSIPQVCRRWRQVALQSSRFWTSILFFHPDLTSSMLSRSNVAPLSVAFNEPRPPPNRAEAVSLLSPVLPHMPHIANLMVMCSADTLRQVADMTLEAPILTSCSLTCVHGDQFQNGSLAIPSSFLHGQAPCLQVLHLSECWLPWTSPLFDNNITTLILTSVQRIDKDEDLHRMIDAFERMPRLRSVVLIGRPSYMNKSTVSRHIKLSKLTSLVMIGNRGDITNLLQLMVIPPSALARVSVLSDHPLFVLDRTAVYNHLSLRHEYFDPEHQPKIRGLRWQAMAENSGYRLALSIQPQTRIASLEPPLSHDGTLALEDEVLDLAISNASLDFNFNASDMMRILAGLAMVGQVHEAFDVIVSPANLNLPPGFWNLLSTYMPQLETIVVVGHKAMGSFCETLIQEVLQGEESPPAAPVETPGQPDSLFACLRNIVLECIDLINAIRYRALLRALGRRERLHGKMNTLCIRRCNLPRKRVLELQAHFQDLVLWDECENGRTNILDYRRSQVPDSAAELE